MAVTVILYRYSIRIYGIKTILAFECLAIPVVACFAGDVLCVGKPPRHTVFKIQYELSEMLSQLGISDLFGHIHCSSKELFYHGPPCHPERKDMLWNFLH